MEDSVVEKKLTDARTGLNTNIGLAQEAIDAAQELLDSPLGATAGQQARSDLEASRTTLIATITEARTLLTGDDIDAMQTMLNTLAGDSSDLTFKIQAMDPVI